MIPQRYALSDLPLDAADHRELPLARGFFEHIKQSERELSVIGWMLLPDREFDSIQIYVNGQDCGTVPMTTREALAQSFPRIPHARHSGVSFKIEVGAARTEIGRIELIGCKDGTPVARMATIFRAGPEYPLPTPGPALMERVVVHANSNLFKITGFKCFGEFMEAICRHADFSAMRRMLDWGCGCGRVTVHYLGLRQGPEVFGCDIDSEAITWCQQELRPGVFVPINPWPPTPYESSSFDLVIGYSIFTHLTQETQAAWLEEMRRIIRPGGLFLASTHGDFTASFSNSPSLAGLSQSGIVDGELDPRLDGVAPEGYYRTVYQTRSYTTREWSKYFEVLEYIERGVGNYQDLIVMRRRSES